jgi:hypothetical protein
MADERPMPADRRHRFDMIPGVYFRFMSPPIENNIDWIVPSTPASEQVGKGLPSLPPKKPARTPPATRSNVMDTLLGDHKLAAPDERGRDPYNTTGRQLRR